MPIANATAATALKLLQNAKRVAVLPCADDDLDAVAASLALAEVLSVRGVYLSVLLAETDQKNRHPLAFLETYRHVSHSGDQAHELTVEIPSDRVPIQSVSYERQSGRLLIHVTPQRGSIAPSSVKLHSHSNMSSDILVIIGARRLQELGPRFSGQAELFYLRPTIAIDYHVDQENFATVNLSDFGARACSVLVYDLVTKLPGALTKPVATTLLAGVLARTASFQREMTSPREFELAATLLEHGADRYSVIRNLYKTKPLPTLKLWGRLLAGLVADPLERAWSVLLTARDFTETATQPQVLAQVVREVLANTARAELITVVYELEQGRASGVLLAAPKGVFAKRAYDQLNRRMQSTVLESTDHVVHVRVTSPPQQVYALVRQLGEQITRPGYTGASEYAQRNSTPRRTSVPAAQCARHAERGTAAATIRRG
ncbi:MAG: hypothetical protein V1895_03345 [Parcubacteria group bacterium]